METRGRSVGVAEPTEIYHRYAFMIVPTVLRGHETMPICKSVRMASRFGLAAEACLRDVELVMAAALARPVMAEII